MWKIKLYKQKVLSSSRLSLAICLILLLTQTNVALNNYMSNFIKVVKLLAYNNMNLSSLRNIVAKSVSLKPNSLIIKNKSFKPQFNKSWKKK
jgi:hypothetical protein